MNKKYNFKSVEELTNEPSEYLVNVKRHKKIKQLRIKQVILWHSLFFAVLFLLSFLLYCIKHLIEGN